MPLQAFSLIFPQTRLFKANNFIYQFKIKGGSSFRREEVIRGDSLDEELEEIIRTVIGNLDNLQPFSSTRFSVYPYKKRWRGVSKVVRKHGERKQRAYPFSIILYLEKNMQNEKQAEQVLSSETEAAQQFPSVSELRSKCSRGHSPLEDAIIKGLSQDMEVEGKVSAAGLKEDPGHHGKKSTRGFNEPQEKSSASTVIVSGTPGKVHPGTTEHDMREEEEGDEEEENADSVPGTPLRPGILTRLARSLSGVVERHMETGGVPGFRREDSLGFVWFKFCSANKKS
ncbi:uncharacterized protein LOC125883727 isoform X2 [Epinephelus fuscoguttatus]|uniref:uncharacterized protein LOC125883727 isoform X2 n=1 Tax=Epinephelus fuscoguttatus TaxID=293821 RepID=UPI0020D0FB6A|nr:uncharacterized protein LOC125883727 isoform X2 [Epinephelus fuscoguttatus]